MSQPQRKLLVTDFDGTLTAKDFYYLVVNRFAPEGLQEYWNGYTSGRLTHFEALAGIFSRVRAEESAMLELLSRSELQPNLASYLQRLDAAGWDVVVASAGCEWYIRRILGAAGVELPIHANPGRFEPSSGLIMELPLDSKYLCHKNGIDKAAIVQEARAAGRLVAFAGDGYPDAPAAKLVEPRYRFARANLQETLQREGLAFHRFEKWADVVENLLAQG
jgi:2,3-diketo-5-methylthio-1-phosphopentane phosphatase